MSDEIKAVEKRTEVLKARNEELDEKLTAAQRKAAIAEAKKTYGRDWKKMLFGAMKHLKVDKETLHTLHSMGAGGQELRDMSNPTFLRRYK